MSLIRILCMALTVILLSSCGGGGGGSSNTADKTAPVLTGIATALTGTGKTATLSVTGSDDVGITSYCFKTTATTPLATDTCFQSSNQKSLDFSVTVPRYYV